MRGGLGDDHYVPDSGVRARCFVLCAAQRFGTNVPHDNRLISPLERVNLLRAGMSGRAHRFVVLGIPVNKTEWITSC
jgi:hypothetical protein